MSIPFEQLDGDRVGLLPCGTTRNPDPDRTIVVIYATDSGNDIILENIEGFLVTKECRNTDQHVVGKAAHLFGVLFEINPIRCHILEVMQMHAPFDAA